MEKRSGTSECCNVKKLDITKMRSLLRSGNLADYSGVLGEVLDEIRFGELRSLILRLYVGADIYIEANSFSKEIGVSEEEFVRRFGSIDDIGDHLGTPEETIGFFDEMIGQCIRWRIENTRENGNYIIISAKSYIDKNYMSSELSLTNVADAAGVCPTYLSTLFKKETGRNLSEYINSVRIERSKALLCCTSKMIYEIAYEVGFQDYRYFSQIFKKCTGQTPRQFQNNANNYV